VASWTSSAWRSSHSRKEGVGMSYVWCRAVDPEAGFIRQVLFGRLRSVFLATRNASFECRAERAGLPEPLACRCRSGPRGAAWQVGNLSWEPRQPRLYGVLSNMTISDSADREVYGTEQQRDRARKRLNCLAHPCGVTKFKRTECRHLSRADFELTARALSRLPRSREKATSVNGDGGYRRPVAGC
jgi:hypothetical protein